MFWDLRERPAQIAGLVALTVFALGLSAMTLWRFYADDPARSGTTISQGRDRHTDSSAAPQASYSPELIPLKWPDGLVAFFPMNNLQGDAFASTKGQRFTASLFSGKAKAATNEPGPFGPSVFFDGKTAYAIGGRDPQPEDIGALDIAKTTGHFTIISWVRDMGGEHGMEFRAGSHVEDGPLTARQYGLYFNGIGYGGRKRVNPHLATQDGPTPGYPWNVDFGATARQVTTGEWHMEAGTYDGEKMLAYLDGVPDSYPEYTEPEPEPGFSMQRTISKNPYYNDGPINNSSTPKVFTIGASLIGNTPYESVNFTKGWIGGIAVFDRALSDQEIKRIRLATISPDEPILDFDFYSYTPGPITAQELGWKSFGGAKVRDLSDGGEGTPAYRMSAPDEESGHLMREGDRHPAIAYFPLTPFQREELSQVTFDLNSTWNASPQRLAARFGGEWYASELDFVATTEHDLASDWTQAEPQSHRLTREAGAWRVLNFGPGAGVLELTTDRRRPEGPLTAIGFYSDEGRGIARIKNLQLWR